MTNPSTNQANPKQTTQPYLPGKEQHLQTIKKTMGVFSTEMDKAMKLLASVDGAKASDDLADKKKAELFALQTSLVDALDAGKKAMKKVKAWLEGIGHA